MRMHPAAVIPEKRLRHEGDGLPVPTRDMLDDVLVHHHLVSRSHQRVEPDVDFGLPGGRHFMVVLLDGDSHLFHLENHFTADVLLRVRRWNWEVAFLMADLAAEIDAFLTHVPDAFVGIDVVVPAMTGLLFSLILCNL